MTDPGDMALGKRNSSVVGTAAGWFAARSHRADGMVKVSSGSAWVRARSLSICSPLKNTRMICSFNPICGRTIGSTSMLICTSLPSADLG